MGFDPFFYTPQMQTRTWAFSLYSDHFFKFACASNYPVSARVRVAMSDVQQEHFSWPTTAAEHACIKIFASASSTSPVLR
jgi:hypothetical protein